MEWNAGERNRQGDMEKRKRREDKKERGKDTMRKRKEEQKRRNECKGKE